jgi:hypothetical protein
MKIPVVLSTVHITIDHDGRLAVELDGRPYADDRVLGRGDLRSVVDEIAEDIGTAVRVEVREADGSTFSDIAIPPEQPAPVATEPSPTPVVPALKGAGFDPGEEIALAYVVARQQADTDGNAVINLPPALLRATRSGLVLVGLSSLTVAPIESPA